MFVWSLGAQRRARLNNVMFKFIENVSFQHVILLLPMELPIELSIDSGVGLLGPIGPQWFNISPHKAN